MLLSYHQAKIPKIWIFYCAQWKNLNFQNICLMIRTQPILRFLLKLFLLYHADSPANASKNFNPNVCPSPKVQDFWKKAFSGCPYVVRAWEAFFTDLVKSLCFSDKFLYFDYFTDWFPVENYSLGSNPSCLYIFPVYIRPGKNQEMESHPSWTHTVLQINLHAYFAEIRNFIHRIKIKH